MLICLHCGSGMIATTREWVSKHGWTIRKRCVKCGRDKIEDTGSKSHGTSPLQTGEKIAKEASMGKSGICKYEGCDKVRLAGGYCYRHYKEVNGHPYTGGLKNHKGGNIEMTDVRVRVKPEVLAERMAQELTEASEQRTVVVVVDSGLFDRLTTQAKASFRDVNQQAAYILHKALNEKADDTYQPGTYQSGSGRRGG
jgi:hypothetical protein